MSATNQPSSSQIASWCEDLISDPIRRANHVPKLVKALQAPSDQDKNLLRLVQALEVFFSDARSSSSLQDQQRASAATAGPEAAHSQWLRRQNLVFLESLFGILQRRNQVELQVAALGACMEGARGQSPGSLNEGLIARLVRVLITCQHAQHCMPHFITRYALYLDVRFYAYRSIAQVATCIPEQNNQQKEADRSSTQPKTNSRLIQTVAQDQLPESIASMFELLAALSACEPAYPPAAAPGKAPATEAAAGAPLWSSAEAPDMDKPPSKKARLAAATQVAKAEPKCLDAKQARKAFSRAWLAFLALPLPRPVLHEVLELLHEGVMPRMADPLLLADFLTHAVRQGGPTAMLALHALFLLITRHGLEYPHFFRCLYGLLTPAMFQMRHRLRLFQLADACLASGMVPAYTAAAFIKRFARLALTASPAGAQLCVAFVHNLLRRHPACLVLLDRPPGASACTGPSSREDPFQEGQADPAKACAMDSSLWEMQTLRNHYCVQVANMVTELDRDLKDRKKTNEIDVTPLAGMSYRSLISSILNRRLKHVPVAFCAETPTTLLDGWATVQ